ncbi:MAG: DUF2130 domain-containing protein [Bacteroidetes bacterium]|nr:DUF2130 domain-containing protein [Bacteroidota bacterium]
MAKENSIKCPECGAEIDVNAVLYHQLSEQAKKENEKKFAKKEQELSEKEKQLKEDRKKQDEVVEQEVDSKLKAEKKKLEESIRKKVNDDKMDEMEAMKKELDEKSEQVKQLGKLKADLARTEREKQELKDQITAEQEEKFNQLLAKEKEKIQNDEGEKNKTELQKRQKLIEDLNSKLEEAKRKLVESSNKQTGEIKEIELRDFLKVTFPIDEIGDVPSGVNGADVMQYVRSNIGQPSGLILYERKETQKKWGADWVSKLKDDGRRAKADICVIVSHAMPPDNQETHFREGVWVCTFSDVKILTTLLRDGLIKQYAAITSQTDKGTKAEMLYAYLHSPEFKNHITGVLDAFKKMDAALQKERVDALKKFAERDADILQAKQSLINFWHKVDRIATDSLSKEIKILETPVQPQLGEGQVEAN